MKGDKLVALQERPVSTAETEREHRTSQWRNVAHGCRLAHAVIITFYPEHREPVTSHHESSLCDQRNMCQSHIHAKHIYPVWQLRYNL